MYVDRFHIVSLCSFPTHILPVLSVRKRLCILCVLPKFHNLPSRGNIIDYCIRNLNSLRQFHIDPSPRFFMLGWLGAVMIYVVAEGVGDSLSHRLVVLARRIASVVARYMVSLGSRINPRQPPRSRYSNSSTSVMTHSEVVFFVFVWVCSYWNNPFGLW